MSAIEPLFRLINANTNIFSKEDYLLIEIELFVRLYDALKEIFRVKYKEYFHTLKFNLDKENEMLEDNLLRCVINDILSTEEYTLQGIAYYTQIPEDIIYDVATGTNTRPSLPLFRKIIELHRSIRPHLYCEIMSKITKQNG